MAKPLIYIQVDVAPYMERVNNMTQVTVTRALTRARIIKDKLDSMPSELASLPFGHVRKSEGQTVLKQKEEAIQAHFDKLQSLQAEYVKIKSAIAKFNNAHTVLVSGKEYTITEVLALKSLLTAMQAHNVKLWAVLRSQDDEKDFLEQSIDKVTEERVLQALGSSASIADKAALTTNKRKDVAEEYAYYIPGHELIPKKYQSEKETIQELVEEIDYTLSEVNAQNTIEV